MKSNRRVTGFTIVELLIVIIVIGVLATLVLVAYSGVTNQAKVASLTADLTQASKQLAIDQSKSLTATSFPTTLALANNGNGITANSGNTFSYSPSPSSNPTSYCLSDSTGAITYYITNGGTPQKGDCTTWGVIGWWKLNGNATDSSGNNYNGTFSGTPTATTGQNGAANGAYTFNNSYITIGLIGSKIDNTTAFSVTGWVKPVNAPSTYNGFFGFRNDATSDFYVLQLQGSSPANALECRYRNTYGNFFTPNSGASMVTPGSWQLVSLTYDGATVICYVNNTQYQAPGASYAPSSTGNFNIGAVNGTNAMTGGSVDDVRLYNRALTATDVQNLYAAGAQ